MELLLRCGQLGALNANENDGRVNVNRNEPENLSIAVGSHGGRLAEVVQANSVA